MLIFRKSYKVSNMLNRQIKSDAIAKNESVWFSGFQFCSPISSVYLFWISWAHMILIQMETREYTGFRHYPHTLPKSSVHRDGDRDCQQHYSRGMLYKEFYEALQLILHSYIPTASRQPTKTPRTYTHHVQAELY